MDLLLIANLAATLVMVGIIWFVQIVHYPLFDAVGPNVFSGYEERHSRLTTWVVGPPMLLELATTLGLVWWRPASVPLWGAWLGALLLSVVWASTAFLQVPQHRLLGAGFVASAHRRLVTSNWIRTLAWSARGLLLLFLAARAPTGS